MDIKKLNSSKGILVDWKADTWHFRRFIKMPNKVIALFCGNQSMKTSSVCFQYVMRILGTHPVPKKNVVYFECKERNLDNLVPHGYYTLNHDGEVLRGWERGTYNIINLPKDGRCTVCGGPVVVHQRRSKRIRFCAQTLPADKESVGDAGETAEIKNTVYPEFKKWLPVYLLKRDITIRNPAMVILDPLAGFSLNGSTNKSEDIVVDFMSYKQPIQAAAGVQRISIYCDEEPPKEFWDEQVPRLLAEDGDLLLGLTPAEQMTWTFDDIYERAKVYYRTDAVIGYYNKIEKDQEYKNVMTTTSIPDIGVMQAATDDNPTLSPSIIEDMFINVDDPDVLATRRYGIHRQISGRIFKSFDYRVHVIDFDEIFPDGIFQSWNHFLMVDYHSHNRWACNWMSISPEDEAFVWDEFCPDPERMVTAVIAKEIALKSKHLRFQFCLIDPEAAVTQTNTGTSTIEDLNRFFWDFRKNGICDHHYWESWNTKGTRGREVVRERLKNSFDCKRPFNNTVRSQGTSKNVPTLWVSSTCRQTARSLRSWRLESWTRSSLNINKERKETPSQKWSHHCTAIEAAFKDIRCKAPRVRRQYSPKPRPYFQTSRGYAYR